MHQGKPYGLHAIGGALSEKDEAFISVAVKRFNNLKVVAGVDSLKQVYNLPDNGSVIVQDTGGNLRVIAYKPVASIDATEADGLTHVIIPMLYSGAVNGSELLRPQEGLPLVVSAQTRRRLLGYSTDLAPRSMRLQRFACEYAPMFQVFVPQNKIQGMIYTQYMQQKPTWYSGAMSEVMQIVGGYGKQDLSDLPDTPLEQAWFLLPKKYEDKIISELSGYRLPAYTGFAHKQGQFQYNYQHNNTDIVSFDDANKPWLVRVGSSGVWAMPLPLVPATTTGAFREYIRSVGDDEILAILDRFGGMPSGEAMPISSSGFEAWRRAGVIIYICDSADFYDHMTYSSAMGWSANTNGTELVNTCYDADFERAMYYGLTYKINLRLGSAIDNGWVKAKPHPITLDTLVAQNYLAKLYKLIEKNNNINRAIKYKLARTRILDIQARAKIVGDHVDENEVNYWSNLELDPIAIHQGKVRQIGKGYLVEGRHIKVPEPIVGGLVSLEVLPQSFSDRYGTAIDTIVLAYYIGNDLKTVKSFKDEREQAGKIESNFEDIMQVGSWEKREPLGKSYIEGDIYTTDIDDREVVPESERVTTIKGVDLGFGKPHFAFHFYFWRTGRMWRNRYYTHETKVTTTGGRKIRAAVAIPYFCRNALIYAKTESFISGSVEESLARLAAGDPNEYSIWTYHPIWAYIDTLEVMNGMPKPVDGRPIWAEIHDVNKSTGYEDTYANEGPWLPALPYDVTSLMYGYENVIWAKEGHPPPPPVNEYKRETQRVGEVKKDLRASILYGSMDKVGTGSHSDHYYLKSPDSSETIFYIDACKTTFGSALYANVSEVSETGQRKRWGNTTLANHGKANHFIGVINE